MSPEGSENQFIPGWDQSCTKIFKEYQNSESNNEADKLIRALNIRRKQRWYETTENLDFKHSSNKAWAY